MNNKTVKVCRLGSLALAAFISGLALSTLANNLQINNTQLAQTSISFDISWENSWRYDGAADDDGYFHDAAWVFFKVRAVNGDGLWHHVKLADIDAQPSGFSTGSAGANMELIVPADRVGLFIRRSAAGAGGGAITSETVRVTWKPKESGVAMGQKVEIQTLGIEMVYVAEGSFWVGDGVSASTFVKTLINTANAKSAPSTVDGKMQGGYPSGQTAPTSETWPNGYNAFYCMKYEITQGQYKDFLNTLTMEQDGARFPNSYNSYRHTVGGSSGARTATAPDRACNYLSWADITAYLDWSCLRPMTELEFEKACRGTVEPIGGEYAWGTPNATAISGLVGTDGSGDEYYTTGNLHVSGNGGPSGPLRAGIFARPGSTREEAGASFWGILDLSGNLRERPILISHATGKLFAGTHGDGTLNANGDANVASWPGADATGAGFRGGVWYYASSCARVSDRRLAAGVNATRNSEYGGRGARSAGVGVGE